MRIGEYIKSASANPERRKALALAKARRFIVAITNYPSQRIFYISVMRGCYRGRERAEWCAKSDYGYDEPRSLALSMSKYEAKICCNYFNGLNPRYNARAIDLLCSGAPAAPEAKAEAA